MGCNHNNSYILVTESTVKLTWVRTVRDGDCGSSERNPDNERRSDNVQRAKTAFIDLGQCNAWEWLATFTVGSVADYEREIRGIWRWFQNWNTHHDAKISYLGVLEFGSKGRLHAHVLLSGVPESFYTPFKPSEYKKLPADLKRLYSLHKGGFGPGLCHCPWWKKGFSTLVPIDGRPQVISYLTKYMTKSNVAASVSFGGHSYFASRGLKRSEKQKIPADIASTMFSRVPASAWRKLSQYDGVLMTACYVLDKDKISGALWDYYKLCFEILQSGMLQQRIEEIL